MRGLRRVQTGRRVGYGLMEDDLYCEGDVEATLSRLAKSVTFFFLLLGTSLVLYSLFANFLIYVLERVLFCAPVFFLSPSRCHMRFLISDSSRLSITRVNVV